MYKSVVHFKKVCKLNTDAKLVKNAKEILTAYENIVKETDGTDLNTYMRCHETFMFAFDEMKQNNWELAIEAFNKVLKIVPDHLSSLGNLGICYGQLAQYTKAITYLDRALEVDPEYEPAIDNKAHYSVLTDGEAPPAAKAVVTNYGRNSVLREGYR